MSESLDLSNDDVVFMDKDKNLTGTSTSKVSEVKATVLDWLSNPYAKKTDWLSDGVECEVLRVGGRWQKGRIRLKLEFIPDEVSPLDDLRSNLNT